MDVKATLTQFIEIKIIQKAPTKYTYTSVEQEKGPDVKSAHRTMARNQVSIPETLKFDSDER